MRSILLKSVKNAPMAAALAVLLQMPVSPVLAQDRTQPDRAPTTPGNPMPGATGLGTTGALGTTGTTTGAAQPAPIAQAERPDPLMAEDVSKVRGADVRGRDDKKIGDVETVLMKPESKQVDRVVVDVGGVLGVGAHRVALPIDELKWDPKAGAFRVSRTEDELKGMPEWRALDTTSASTGSTTPPDGRNTGTNR